MHGTSPIISYDEKPHDNTTSKKTFEIRITGVTKLLRRSHHSDNNDSVTNMNILGIMISKLRNTINHLDSRLTKGNAHFLAHLLCESTMNHGVSKWPLGKT